MNLLRLKDYLISKIWSVFIGYSLGQVGKNFLISSPLKIDNSKKIIIGNNVRVGYKCWLSVSSQSDESELVIGDGSRVGSFAHIISLNSIKLGKNVLLADKVYISDNIHQYQNVDIPIMKQSIRYVDSVIIGDGSWIGENVCVIGASIGKNSVIGANSVVTKSIPDYSIAVGAPARVIKKYDPVIKKWISVK